MRISAITRQLTVLLVASLFATPVLSEGDPEAGKSKSLTCSACHGADGNSVNPLWPSIAGQHESFIAAQLMAFRSGKRANALMSSQATNLSDQDIADLAAYFSSQKLKGLTADPALVEDGQRIYRGGNKDSGLSACIACHGPSGNGNPPAMMPRISGQHAAYTALTLRDYASGNRESGQNQMMNNIAALMSDAEIEAVAAYLQGLRGN